MCMEAPKTSWRRADRELPPEGDEGGSDDVLVQRDDGTHQVAYYDYAAESWVDRWGFELASSTITHWRELPESAQD